MGRSPATRKLGSAAEGRRLGFSLPKQTYRREGKQTAPKSGGAPAPPRERLHLLPPAPGGWHKVGPEPTPLCPSSQQSSSFDTPQGSPGWGGCREGAAPAAPPHRPKPNRAGGWGAPPDTQVGPRRLANLEEPRPAAPALSPRSGGGERDPPGTVPRLSMLRQTRISSRP